MFTLLLLSVFFFSFSFSVPRHYVFVKESKTWAEAQRYCRDKYIDLATIENDQQTNQLINTFKDDSIDLAWIGLYDDLNSWKWTLEDSDFFKVGEKDFRNWFKLDQVNNGGQYMYVYMYSGMWYTTVWYSELPFICYDGRMNASASYVFVSQYKNWTEAQSYCREHHTDLVSIRNETENYRVQSLVPYDYYSVWIGLYRTRYWSDQSNSSFNNWRTGQPDSTGSCTVVSFSNSGKWTDEFCFSRYPFICYSVSSLTSSHQYHFVSVNKTWTEAQRYCRQNYTDLATIDNMEEMIRLINTVNGSYNGSAWIGLYDDVLGNSWRWSLEDNDLYQEGERDFRNWYHEPDNRRGNELCVYMDYNGKWFDQSCDNSNKFVCYDGRANTTQNYIKINDWKTWSEARRYCREHYTDLANVRNLTENQRILERASGGVWIGLYRNRTWSDHQITNYENWKPGIPFSAEQPDNGVSDYVLMGSQHCTAVSLKDSGRWTDENCFSSIPFFCYNRTCTQSSCTHQYHFVSVNKTWTEAQRYCRQNYTDLATIANMEEMNRLINTVNGSYNGSAWIGLYDDVNSWRWSLDNAALEGGFKGWYVQQPVNWGGQSLCVSMPAFYGVWVDVPCSNLYHFVCYDGRQNATAQYVYVNQFKTWTEAQRYCRENHSDLVSIRNEMEIHKIQYLLKNYSFYIVWIGLYRDRYWSDQSNSSFSNWMTGQPYHEGSCTVVSFRDTGKWTNENCITALPFICYSVSSLTSSHQYHFVSVNKTWTEAQRYCRQNYTDLATIDNMEEMNRLINTVNGSYNGSAWIGLYDDVKNWTWSLEDNDFYQEGEKDFRNWYHEPNNFGGREMCVYMFDGTWFDSSCDNQNSFVCYDGRENTSQKYIWVSERRTWTGAQSYCREKYTDLASVRNETERQQILNVTYDIIAWIGLHRNRLWSDQSNSSFTYWRQMVMSEITQPDNGFNTPWAGPQHCTAVSLQQFGQWTDERCLDSLPFFCYNGDTVGLRVKFTSLESLSKSEIEDLVIIQLQEEFIRQGLPSNFTMHLRNYRKTSP
ncbi:unnamed protein product [Leuciscus chuanchicus]